MDKTYELIFCIVNTGFSGTVMDAARSAGATGGTILRGRGSAGKEAEDFFHIQIEPEKEIVMILAPVEIKDNIMTSIYKEAGLASAGQGIIFSLPVTRTAGLSQVHENQENNAV
ncbi:MAG: P-II family nitrogen regulator [Oscillospiraceae bacterium]|nr:P-II family nitrogen regulator [Oscillospiraceae bacterium]MBO7728510.1 P-II family nitrogen regulator [Oscillospiraceae bacterium]MBP5168131.1 P-II family nitrogen regulator [Oscillospiraceae bacterium]